jgi:hypothetical protein
MIASKCLFFRRKVVEGSSTFTFVFRLPVRFFHFPIDHPSKLERATLVKIVLKHLQSEVYEVECTHIFPVNFRNKSNKSGLLRNNAGGD